jgi:hypothetical protein
VDVVTPAEVEAHATLSRKENAQEDPDVDSATRAEEVEEEVDTNI